MRILTVILLLLASTFAFAGADYAREKKWADEIIPGIVIGDPVFLESGQGHKFLGIFTGAGDAAKSDARMGVIVIHGIGLHPEWGMIGILRMQLAELGFATLSIQMPVLASDAAGDDYTPLFPEAAGRIASAVDFLQARGYQKIAVVSHSLGSAMSRMYVAKNPSVLAAWASLGMGRDYTYSGIRIPVLDMYGEQDLPPVLKMANKRAASLKNNSKSRQVRVPGSDHFYNNHEAEMVQEVNNFLRSIK